MSDIPCKICGQLRETVIHCNQSCAFNHHFVADFAAPSLSELREQITQVATDVGLLAAVLLADAASDDFGRALDTKADEARALAVRSAFAGPSQDGTMSAE